MGRRARWPAHRAASSAGPAPRRCYREMGRGDGPRRAQTSTHSRDILIFQITRQDHDATDKGRKPKKEKHSRTNEHQNHELPVLYPRNCGEPIRISLRSESFTATAKAATTGHTQSTMPASRRAANLPASPATPTHPRVVSAVNARSPAICGMTRLASLRNASEAPGSASSGVVPPPEPYGSAAEALTVALRRFGSISQQSTKKKAGMMTVAIRRNMAMS